MLFALNKTIATAPFTSTSIKKKYVNPLFVMNEQSVTLEALKVFAGNTDIPLGSTIYVDAVNFASAWARQIYKIDEV